MNNMNPFMKRILVAVYMVVMVAMVACAPKQDIIHSNIDNLQKSEMVQHEIIPQMGTPLAAPRMAQANDIETIFFSCEFQED